MDQLDYSNEQELIENCIAEIISDSDKDVGRVVARNLEEMNRIFQPDVIKSVIKDLNAWKKARTFEGKILELNKEFQHSFVISDEEVNVEGMIHQIEELADGSIKATIFKGERRLYTHDWLSKTYLPLIYGMAIANMYECDRIIISYYMVKHGSEVWQTFDNEDWDIQAEILKVQLKKLIEGKEKQAFVGVHCAYCSRKSICNSYKQEIMESFEIKSIHELFNIPMKELMEYISNLDVQKGLLKDRSEELKNILLHELMNKGLDHSNFGEFQVSIEQKKTYDCDIDGIIEAIDPKDYKRLMKINRKKLESYLKGLSLDERIMIMKYLEVKYYKPSLKIKNKKQSIGDSDLKEILF